MESCSRSQNFHYPDLIVLIPLEKRQFLQGFQRIHVIGMFTYVIPHSSKVGAHTGAQIHLPIFLCPHFLQTSKERKPHVSF